MEINADQVACEELLLSQCQFGFQSRLNVLSSSASLRLSQSTFQTVGTLLWQCHGSCCHLQIVNSFITMCIQAYVNWVIRHVLCGLLEALFLFKLQGWWCEVTNSSRSTQLMAQTILAIIFFKFSFTLLVYSWSLHQQVTHHNVWCNSKKAYCIVLNHRDKTSHNFTNSDALIIPKIYNTWYFISQQLCCD